MPPAKQDLIAAYRRQGERLEGIVAGLSDQDLARTVYEGWSARGVLSHLASVAGSAQFFIGMAQSGGQGMGTGFDVNQWNAEQVAAREGKPLTEIMSEFRTGHEASIKAVEAAPDELMSKQIPNFEGGMSSLAEMIQGAATDHEAVHINDLERALRS